MLPEVISETLLTKLLNDMKGLILEKKTSSLETFSNKNSRIRAAATQPVQYIQPENRMSDRTIHILSECKVFR